MDLARMNRILEIFWWTMAILSMLGVFIMTFVDGFDKWALWYWLPLICVILALVRRFASKRLSKSQAERDSKK